MNSLAPESLRRWLRRELKHAAQLSLLLLVVTGLAAIGLRAAWPAFADHWERANDRLGRVALHQHPLALIRTFSDRLHESEYGWRILSWSQPFNVTSARAKLRDEFPEIIGVRDGQPVIPRAEALRRADPGRFHERETDFLTRYLQIETYRFTWLYGEEDTFGVPDQTAALGQLATKIFGVPDAFIFTLRSLVVAGPMSIALFCTVLVIAGVALRQAARPSRRWLKVLLWLPLASALVWVAILPMAIAAAVFGRLTANTPLIVAISVIPLQLLLARFGLRILHHLLRNVPRGASPAKALAVLTPPALAVPVFAKPSRPATPAAPTADFPAPPAPPAPLRSGQTRQP